ncbi:hypothetical protein [Kitasatospora sp. NPDC088346]|uniref:hypothetical protein n=1 Tax=Kitasatospora sp. NPDC088346 TaxID=3364073 RepID=UPI003824D6D3
MPSCSFFRPSTRALTLSTGTGAAVTGVARIKDVSTRIVASSRASLVREDPETRRRRMHDLVRAYAHAHAHAAANTP